MTIAVKPMPIAALPPGPSTEDPDTFDDKADDVVAALPPMIAQQNAANEATYQNALAAAESSSAAADFAHEALQYRDAALGYRDEAADAAIAAAASAAAAAQLTSTSTTTLPLQTGTASLQTQAGAGYKPGVPILLIDRSNPVRKMAGTVVSYSGPTLIALVTAVEGIGSASSWDITVCGIQGGPGPMGGLAGGTVTGKLTVTGSATTLGMVLTNSAEKVVVRGTGLAGALDYDVTAQTVMLFTAPATGAWTPNITGSAEADLNALLEIGQALTVVLLVTQGSTAYLPAGVKVQGLTVVPRWQGGLAPAAGNPNSIDSYTYTVIRTASNAYVVLAALAQFK